MVHSFWIRWGFAPVGAGFEEVIVQGIAYFKKDIGVYPLAAHDFVEVFAGVADLVRQPSDAPPLPRKLHLYKFPDVKGFNRGVFVSVHNAVCLELPPLFPSNKKGGESFLVCAYLVLRYRQTPATSISTEKFPPLRKLPLLILTWLMILAIFKTENKSVKLNYYILCSFILL